MLQTLEDPVEAISTVTFSRDSKILALVLKDSIIKLYNAGLGAVRQILQGYIDIIRIVFFLLNSRILVLALNNNTIKL